MTLLEKEEVGSLSFVKQKLITKLLKRGSQLNIRNNRDITAIDIGYSHKLFIQDVESTSKNFSDFVTALFKFCSHTDSTLWIQFFMHLCQVQQDSLETYYTMLANALSSKNV